MAYEVKEARSSSKSNAQGTPSVHHFELTHDPERGYVTVSHHGGPRAEASESHTFGSGEGPDLIGHLGHHMPIFGEVQGSKPVGGEDSGLEKQAGKVGRAVQSVQGEQRHAAVMNEGAQEA